MEITIKEAALNYLQNKFTADQHLFLALDDGSSKYSQLGGTCAIGNKFQIVVADELDPEYAFPLSNNANLPLTTGDLEQMYLGHGLVLDHQLGSLVLRDDTGILDGAVMVNKPQVLTKEVQEQLGNKIC